VGTDGYISIAGSFGNTIDFGGSPLTSTGSTDVFIAKFTNSGDHEWSFSEGTSGADYARAMALDSSNNIFVSTYTSCNVLINKYSASGTLIWSDPLTSSRCVSGNSIDINNGSFLAVTGYYRYALYLGSETLISLGNNDVFLLNLQP
jgi:hypothetical protein